MRFRHGLLVLVLMILVLLNACSFLPAESFTLSNQALLVLDWNNQHRFIPTYILNVEIVDVRDVPGSGVEFDIFYPDKTDASGINNTNLEWVSSNQGASGALVGIDVSAFDTFELKYTLLSINGNTTTGTGINLIVGSILGPTASGAEFGFSPNPISLSGTHSATAIPQTTVGTDVIQMVGFTAYIPDWISPNNWSSDGSLVTLLIEPAPGVTQIPEPTMTAILLIGIAVLKQKIILAGKGFRQLFIGT